MLKIERAKNEISNQANEGMVIAEVQVSFSGGLTPKTAQHAGQGALIVASTEELDSRIVHEALELGGHSKVRAEDSFLQPVPLSRRFENTLQELPDGTTIHMAEMKKDAKILKDSSKPALVVSNGPDLGGGASRIVVMNVFTPSERPEDFGLRSNAGRRTLKKAA